MLHDVEQPLFLSQVADCLVRLGAEACEGAEHLDGLLLGAPAALDQLRIEQLSEAELLLKAYERRVALLL